MKIPGTRFTLIREFSDYPTKNSKKRTRMLEVQCECGNVIIVRKAHVTCGKTKSCGCLVRDTLINRNTTHGMSHAECRNVFYSMHNRCYNPNHMSYKNYGGRGITVCNEWHDMSNFVKWCKENNYRKGLQIDRINNDGNYEPNNCRLVTVKENLRNRRITVIKDNMCLEDWISYLSDKHNILKTTLHSRYYSMKRRGYSDEEINENSIINYKRRTRQSITNPKEKS